MGRDHAKEEVRWRLRVSGLLTLTGPAGVGKSRLAREVASELAEDGEAVAWVDLAPLSDPASVLPAVAAAAGAGPAASPSLLDAVTTELGDDPLVVVLDNCEHLLRACAEVAERLLGGCRGVRILATSRERLRAAGEVVWPVPALSLPAEGPASLPEAFVASEAVQLFCDRAAALQRGFLPTAENVEAVVEICRRLDANPLAIELAAAHVVSLAAPEIAARLDDRFSLLKGGVTTAPQRQRSLRAALDWSDQLLTPPERALLRRLSVFAGSFSLRAVEEVCAGDGLERDRVLDLLTRLVDKSLVEADPTGRAARFRLLETVRAYAAERLAEEGATAALAERHSAWCLSQLEGAEDRAWVERLQVDHDSLRAAGEWALAHGRAEVALRLAGARARLWARRGRFAEARAALERVLAATQGEHHPLRAALLVDAGLAALAGGDLDAAHRHLLAAVALAGDEPDPELAARTRVLLAFAATFDDDVARVEDLEQTAAEVAATVDDASRAEARAACGQARMCRGEPVAARRHFREAVVAARGGGETSILTTALIGLGSAELLRGDYSPAEGHLSEGIRVAASLGDAYSEVLAGTWLGELALVRGDHDEARRRSKECLTAARTMGAPHPLARSLLGLGLAALQTGRPGAAGAAFEEAGALARRAGLAHLAIRALVGSGQAALALGDAAGARADFDEAMSMARRRADRAGEALAFEGCAELSRADGDVRAAGNRYRQALTRHAHVGDPSAVARCLEALGRLAGEEDELSAAARLLGAADSLRARRGCARPGGHDEEHTAVVESLRQGLAECFGREWCRGEAMSAEAAVAYAERWRGPKRPRPTEGWEALTGAERRVAELAAQGRTNAEIAGNLGIAPATVKAHLRRVFAKLDIQSRTALAADPRRDGTVPER